MKDVIFNADSEGNIRLTKKSKDIPKDPHTEMMVAFVKFQEAAKSYSVGVGIRHIRVVGDVLSLDTCKLEFSSY